MPRNQADKYRLFTVLPGRRKQKMERVKLTAKSSVLSFLTQHVVYCGCVLELNRHLSKHQRKHSNTGVSESSVRLFIYVADRGDQPVPYPMTAALAKEVMVPRGEPLVNSIYVAVSTMEKVKNDKVTADNSSAFLVTLSADPEDADLQLVNIDVNISPKDLFLVDGDVIVIKRLPVKTTVIQKYPSMPENLLAGFVSAVCYAEPLLRVQTAREKRNLLKAEQEDQVLSPITLLPSSVTEAQRERTANNMKLIDSELIGEEFTVTSMAPKTLAERANELKFLMHKLDIPEDRMKEFTKTADDYASYGVTSLMFELEDRLHHLKSIAGYEREAFESEEEFERWRIDERENVLSLMRHVMFRRAPFNAEFHVTLVSASGIKAADVTRTSDAWVLMILGAQRQSSEVCLKTLTPKWNQSFIFTLSSLAKPMILCLYDWNALTSAVYLGAATLDFLENIELLDGCEHELTLPIDTCGTITIRIQAFSELMPFLTRARSITPGPPQPDFMKLDFHACYKLLFAALLPTGIVVDQSPWILQEVGARFGISSVACSMQKMNLLLAIEPQYTLDFAKCLAAHARNFSRPRCVITKAEAVKSQQMLISFREFCYDQYLPGCFKLLGMAVPGMPIPAVEIVIHALLESYLFKHDSSGEGAGEDQQQQQLDEAEEKVFCDGIDRALTSGVKKNCKDICKDIPWEKESYGSAFVKCVNEGYPRVFNTYLKVLSSVIPKPLLPKVQSSLVKSISAHLESDLVLYCDIVLAKPVIHTRDVLDGYQAVIAFGDMVNKTVHVPLVVPSNTGLLFLWVRKTKDVLLEWCRRSVEVDTLLPLTTSVTHSSAVVDVYSACTQVIEQLKLLSIQDVYVWLQVGELIVATISSFFVQESELGVKLLDGLKLPQTLLAPAPKRAPVKVPTPPLGGKPQPVPDNSSDDGKNTILRQVCVVLSNIEEGQSFVDKMVTSVEEGISRFQKEKEEQNEEDGSKKDDEATKKKDDERTSIVSESLSGGVSNALKASTAARNKLLQRLSDILCAPAASSIQKALSTTAHAPEQKLLPTSVGSLASTTATQRTEVQVKALGDDEGFTEKMVSDIVKFFDHAFQSAAESLSRRIYRDLLLTCWGTLVRLFAAAVSFTNPANKPYSGMNVTGLAETFDTALSMFLDYFSPDENGVPKSALEKNADYLKTLRLLALYEQTTEQLIGLVRILQPGKKPNKEAEEEIKEVLRGTTAVEVAQLLAVRSSQGDLWAKAYDNETSGSEDSQRVRDHFSLPPSELLLNQWTGHANGKRSKLYLLSRHVCLDLASATTMTDDNGFVIMLDTVTDVSIVKASRLYNGLKITTSAPADEQPPVITMRMSKLVIVANAIIVQAKLVGNLNFASKPTLTKSPSSDLSDSKSPRSPKSK